MRVQNITDHVQLSVRQAEEKAFELNNKEITSEVLKKFEEVLLRVMLREARQSALSSKSAGPSNAIYGDLMDDYLSELIVDQGGIGLSRSIGDQMRSQIEAAKLIM